MVCLVHAGGKESLSRHDEGVSVRVRVSARGWNPPRGRLLYPNIDGGETHIVLMIYVCTNN